MAFNKINKGQPDWHIPLNENFDGIADGSLLPESVPQTNEAGILLLNKEQTLMTGKSEDGTLGGGISLELTADDEVNNKFLIELQQLYGTAPTHLRFAGRDANGEATAGCYVDLPQVGAMANLAKIHTTQNLPVEYGSFMPTYTNNKNEPITGINYTRQMGGWLRVGRECTIYGELICTRGTSGASQELYLGNIPFMMSSHASRNLVSTGYVLNWKDLSGNPMQFTGWMPAEVPYVAFMQYSSYITGNTVGLFALKTDNIHNSGPTVIDFQSTFIIA